MTDLTAPPKQAPDPDQTNVGGCQQDACSLPREYLGPFFGVGMGKIFIRTKCGDTPVLDVRGWGYLIGTGGGLAMSEDDAIKVQDQFEAWVVAALNHYAENTEMRDGESRVTTITKQP